ncbi:PIN domain-containing protein [Halomicrobium salinisoli]|uniref:PIN domain-containing protein n=1 Tax=Halomicrobium salinisoli TaxID=2878391 RepID=UPI001CF03671|nr:PIN domain-containing protein [Halomicrobium salinisoli]
MAYTADAVSLLVYLVDALPEAADRVFAEAEAGETIVQVPSTALAEVLYSVAHDKDVRGVTLSGTPEDARQALVGNGPVSVAPVDDAELAEYAQVVEEFSIHDALVVASHRAQGTNAIITTDGVIRDAGYETLWG